MLQFFGIANGLSKEKSTSAFFEYRGNLIIIDCSIDTCRELLDQIMLGVLGCLQLIWVGILDVV